MNHSASMTTKDIYSIALSALALFFSLITFAMNYTASHLNAELARKPVIIFEYESENGWALRNIGAGPALNILVAQRKENGKWFNPVRIPPLPRDGKFVLKWLDHVNSTDLGATYSDTENLPYTAICADDLNKVSSGSGFGPWDEKNIRKHWRVATYR